MSNKNNDNSSGSKKKKIVASAIAIALAAALMIGGTFSYLSASSDEVENTFSPNNVDVNIEESGNGDYNIIPGTSETKDPTVKVTTSVDAYVYLVVEDTTDGLVDYEIDTDVWTLLYTYDEDSCPCYDDGNSCSDTCECGLCTDDGTIYVYYTTVSASDNAQSLSVLVDNTVSYSSAITNEDLEDYEDDDLTLSFTAYAIQMEPFCEDSKDDDAVEDGAEEAFLFAYYDINPDENVSGEVALVCTESKIKAALKDSDVEYIILVDDIAVTFSDCEATSDGSVPMIPVLTVTKDTTIDLQSYTLSFDLDNFTNNEIASGSLNGCPVLIYVSSGDLTIVADEGGAVDASAGLNSAYAVTVYNADSTVTIDGGSYTGASHVVYAANGDVVINDGYFEFADAWESFMNRYYSSDLTYYLGFMLNCYDSSRSAGTASIVVYGGSYVNFDPSNCVAEGSGTNFVADGYTVSESTNDDGDTVYTVVESSSSEDNSSSEE